MSAIKPATKQQIAEDASASDRRQSRTDQWAAIGAESFSSGGGNPTMVLAPPMRRGAGMFTSARTEAQGQTAQAIATWAAIPGGVVDGGELIHFAIKPSMWRPALDSAAWIVVGAVLAATLLFTGRSLPGLTILMTAQSALAVGFARFAIAIVQWVPTWYVLTNRRLIEIRGVRTPIISSCPLINVRNTYLGSSTFERLLRLGTILYVCNDEESVPRAWRSISEPEEIHARIRRAIEHAIDNQTPES